MRSAKAQAAIDKLLKESGTTTSGSTTPKTGNSVSGNASAQAAINKLLGNSTPATPNLNAMAGDSRYAAPTPTPAANLGQNAGVNGVELPKFFTPQYTSSGETNAMAGDSRYAPKGMQATTTPFDSISKLTDLDSRLPRLFNQENELSKSDENNLPARYFSKAEIDSRSNELSEYYKKLDAVRKELSADNLWNPDMETWYKANRGNLDILSQNNENRRAFYSQYSDAHAFARDRDRNARIIAAQKTRDTTIENYKRRANGADINNDIEAAQKELEDAQAALKVAKKTPFALTTDLSTLGDNLDTMVQNDSRLAPVGTNVFAQRSSQLPQETDLNNVEDLDALLQSSKPNPANAFLPRPQTDEKTQTPEDARTQRISEAQAAVKKAQERLNELKSIKYQIDFDFNNEKLKAESANLSLDEIDAKVAKSQQAADEALETEKGSGWEGLAGRLVQGGISTEEDTAYTAEVSAKAQQMIDNSAAKAQATQDARAELEHWKAIREYKLAELAHADTDFLETANTAVAKPMQKEEFNALLDDYYFGAEIDKTTRLKTGNISEEEFIASLGNLVEFYKEHSDWFKGSKRDPGEIGIALSQMTDDENNLYNYYEKKYGLETANEYLDSIKDLLLMRKAETEVTGNPGVWDITKSAVTAGGNQWVSGMNTAMAQYLKLGNGETNTTLANLEAQVVKQKLADDTSSVGKIKNTWFDVVSNVTNMAPSLVLSTMLGMIGSGLFAGELTNLGAAAATGAFDMGLVSTKKFYDAFTKASKLAGSTMLGMSAAGNGYTEALDMGLSPAQARTYGLLTGASEAALETILGGLTEFRIVTPDGISALLTKKIDSMVGKPLLRTLGHLALSTASEVNEEVLQDLLSPAFNSIITGADYDAPTIEELAYTALVTTLTTGLLEGKNAIREGYTQGTDWNMFFNSYMQAKDMNPDLVGPNYLRMLDYCAEAVSYGEDSEFRKQMQPYLDAMQSAIQTSDPTGFMTAVAQISPDAMLAINKARAEGYEEYIAAPAREKNTARFNEAQLNRLVTDKTEIKKLFPDASKFDRGRIVAAVSDIMQGKQISPEAKALLTTPETAAVVAELLSGTTYGVELYEDRVQVDENGKVAREERTYKPIVEAVLKTDATKLAEAYDTIATRISEDRASVEKYHAGQSVPVAETEATTEAPAAFDLDRHDILWKLNGAGIEFSQINDITTTIYKLFTGERLTATDIRILSDGVSNSKTDSTVRGIISDILNANGKASAKLAQNLMRGAETYAELTDMYNKLSDEIALETNPTASAEKTKPVVDQDGTNIIDPNGDYAKLSDRDKMEILAYKYLAENTDGVKITDVIIDASLSPVENGRRVTGTTTIRVNPASYGNTKAVGNTRVFQAQRLGETVGHEMFHVKLDAIGSRNAATGKASEARLNAITNVLNNARAVEGDGVVDSRLSSMYANVRSGHETLWRTQQDISTEVDPETYEYKVALTEEQQTAFDNYVAPYLTRDAIEEEVACDYIGELFSSRATLNKVTQQDTDLVYKILSSLYKYRAYNKNNQVLRDLQILDDTAAMLWGSVKVEEARSDLAAAATDADTVVNKNVLKKHMSQSWSDQVNDLLTMFDDPTEARRPINEYFVPCTVNGNEGLVSRGLGKGAIIAKYSALKEALDTGVISESDLRNLEMILKQNNTLLASGDSKHPSDIRIKTKNSEGENIYIVLRPAGKTNLKSSTMKSYNTIVEITGETVNPRIEQTRTSDAKKAKVVETKTETAQAETTKPKATQTETVSEVTTTEATIESETETPVEATGETARDRLNRPEIPTLEDFNGDIQAFNEAMYNTYVDMQVGTILNEDAFGRELPMRLVNAVTENAREFFDEAGHPNVYVPGPDGTFVASSEQNVSNAEYLIKAQMPLIINFAGQRSDNYSGRYDSYGTSIDEIMEAVDAEGEYDSIIFRNVIASDDEMYEELVVPLWDEQKLQLEFSEAHLDQLAAENPNEPNGENTTVQLPDGTQMSLVSMDYDLRDGSESQMLKDLQEYCGYSSDDIEALYENLKALMDYIRPNAKILDMNESYTRDNRPYSPYKENSDPLYKISLDMSTLCRKRILTQHIVENLQLKLNKPLRADEQIAVRDLLKTYRQEHENLLVACAMCYVEAARLKSPKFIEEFLGDPEAAVKRYYALSSNKYKTEVNKWFADHGFTKPTGKTKKKTGEAEVKNLTKKEIATYDEAHNTDLATELAQLKKQLQETYTPENAREQQTMDTLAEMLSKPPEEFRANFLSADALTKLAIDESTADIYKAYVDFIRVKTHSKGLQTDIPYYYGDSKRGNAKNQGKVVTDKFIKDVNKENGMRFSSWSDFQMIHLLDMMTAVMEMSVRGAKMHGYTKFLEQVRIFGKTGMMFNCSGVPIGTGFNEDGSLAFDPNESVLVYGKDGEYDARAAREEFPETVGLQCIGISVEHVKALMDSEMIDYIIPYHTSGLNERLRNMAGIGGWFNFEDYQNAKVDPSIAKEGRPQKWHKEPTFSEFMITNKTAALKYLKDNHADRLDALTKNEHDGTYVSDGLICMRASAEKYKDLCNKRGMLPKFSYVEVKNGKAKETVDLSQELNYWKVLIDRKMINQQTGVLIEQKAVRPEFDFDVIKDEIDKAVKAYDPGLEQSAVDYIMQATHGGNIQEHIDEMGTEAINKEIEQIEKGSKKLKELDIQKLKAQAQQHSLTDMNQLYAVSEDVRNEFKENPAVQQFSFRALVRNEVDTAEKLERQGMDSESIRRETGFFRGMDGRWRYEMDDSQARFHLDSVDAIKQENADRVDRWNTETEILNASVSGLYQSIKERDSSSQNLSPYQMPNVFWMYDAAKNGDYRKAEDYADEIAGADEDLYDDCYAYISYWREVNMLKAETKLRFMKPTTLGKLMDHPELFAAYPQLEDIPVRIKKLNDALGEVTFRRLGNGGTSNWEIKLDSIKNDSYTTAEILLHEVQHLIQESSGFASGSKSVGSAAYERSAGEIEARDVESRINLTAEERRQLRPDIDREDAIVKISGPRDVRSERSKQHSNQYSINGKVITGSFFSGGGTFEYALKHDIVSAFGVEWDYRPSGLFRANNGDSVYVADVRNFIKQIKNYDGKLEYFHASPSCQRASRANNKGGETELDVTTAQATIEAIRATTPQIVTVENVPEYIKFDSYKNIIKTLEDLGYTYDTVIINSKGYGSNTARERMIIRAVKNGTLPALPGETYVNEDGITIAGRNGEVTGDWYSPFAEEIEALEDAKSREGHGINGIPDYVIKRLEEQYPNAKLNIWWNANTGRVEGLTKPLLLVGGVKSGELYFVDAGKPAPTLTTKIGDMRIILPDGTVKAVSPELAAKWQGIEGYSRTDPITGKQLGKTATFKVIGNGMAGETTRLIVQDLFNSQKEAGYIVDTDNADATTQDLTETQYKTAVDLLKDTKQSYEDALANGADPEVIDQLKHQVEEGEAMINRMLNRSGTGETKQQEKVSNTNNKLFPDDGIQYSLRTAPPPKVDYSDEIKRLPGYERHRINWDNPSIENAYNIQGISDRYERDKNSYEFGVSGIIDAETGLPYIPEQNQYSFTPNHSSAMQDIIDDVTSRPDSHATEISKFKTDTLDNGSIFSDAEKVDPKYIDDAFAYDRETEKASMLQAQAALNADFNGEVTRLENQSNWGGGVDTDIAMGILDRIDNIDDKIAWAEQIAERVREQGRGIQALAKYSHTPDGVILRAVRALRQSNLSQAEKLAVLRDVTGFAQQLKAMKGTSTGLIDLIKDQALMRNTPVSNRTLQNLQKQDVTFLYDAALNQLDQIAKDYIPATVGKKISTYQTMAHLLNPRTFLRNLTSNEAFDTMDIIANNIAKPMDAFLSLFTGQQTVGWEWGALSKEGRAGRRAGRQRTQVEVALDISPEEGKDKYGTARRTNKMVGGWGARAMSSLEKVMGYELNVPDEAAKGLIMADVINSLDPMVKAGTISEDQAVQLAVEQALYRTFQDETWVGNRLRDIKKALNTVGVGSSEATRRAVNGGNLTNPSGKTPDVIKDFGLGDLVCKYTQVPGALITRSVEYGPTGLAKCIVNLYRMAEAQKNFKAKAATAGISETDAAYNNTLNFDRFHAQRNAALQMGRFVTGSGLLALFTAMAKAGLLRRNDEDEDPDLLALETAAGLSGTQINISALERWADGTNDSVLPQAGDKLASVDFLEPLNSLLALGTVLAKRNEEVSAYDLAIDSFQTLYADIAELSVFQTIGTVKDTITYHDEESKVPVGLEVAIELGKSSVTGFVPSLIRQTATAADPFYRDLYTGENDIENLGDQVQSTLPFFRQNLPTKLDNFGNVKTYEADPFLRALNASVMPGSINTYRPNQNLDELRDVYNATGEDAIVPSRNGAYSVKDGNGVRYELTPDERRQYLTTRGNISDTLMRELMQSDIYREADETKRAEMLKTLNSYAEHKAKEEFLGAKGADYSSRKYESLDKYMQTEGLSFADAYDLTANTETSTFTTVDKNSVVSKLSEMYRAGTLDKQQFLDSYYTEMRLREDEDDSAYNKLVGAVDIGVEPDAHFVHATALTGFEATKDENGESISGSKVAQQMTYLAEQCDAGKLNSEQAYYYYGTLQDSYPEHAEEAKAAGIDGVTYAHILGEAYTTKVELGSGKQDNLCPIIYDYYRQGSITVDQADTLYHILFPTAKSAYKQAWHKR